MGWARGERCSCPREKHREGSQKKAWMSGVLGIEKAEWREQERGWERQASGDAWVP